MKQSQAILNQATFDSSVMNSVNRKRTEAGRIRALSTSNAISQIYPDSESVFLKVCEVMFRKADGKCSCGAPILSSFKRLKRRDKKTGEAKKLYKYKCKHCKTVFSPMAKTPLKKCKVDLNIVIALAYWLFTSTHGVTAAEVQKRFGLKYETAWNLLMRIRIWMSMVVGNYKFNDTIVEVDETFPKVPTGLGKNFKFSRGLGSQRIQPVVTIIEQGGEGKAKAFVVNEVNTQTIRPIFQQDVSTSTSVFSDGKNVYNFLNNAGYLHMACNHNAKEWSNNGVHVNTAEAFNTYLKSQLTRVHRGVGRNHLEKYVNELCFRFSNRSKSVYQALTNMFEALPSLHADIKIEPNFFRK